MGWVLTFIGISALVILHEFGHFAAAKAVGMHVERFSLFFGPAIFKVKRGETEYRIGTVPLGGYVKIWGMSPAELEPAPMPATARASVPGLSRRPLAAAVAGPSEQAAAGATTLGAIAPEERDARRAYMNQHVWRRIVVIAAGPAMNVLVAFVILAGVYMFSAQHESSSRAVIASVEHNMPASGVLRKGDVLVAVEGRPVVIHGESESFIGQIAAHRCAGTQVNGCVASTPVRFTVLRGKQLLHLSVTPRYDAKEKRALVGIHSGPVLSRDSVAQALSASVSEMWSVTTETVSRVSQVFTSAQARKQVHGIVGVSHVESEAFSFGAADALYVLALLSLSLAILNMFPFLPLDGGHIFWALAEKLRGRAIPFAVMERASVVGIALVLVLAAIGFSNDLHSLANGSLTLKR